MVTFNLLTQPWIPVAQQQQTSERSLLEVLQQAHSIQAIPHNNPLVVIAVLRLLLAIVVRVYHLTEQQHWVALFEQGRFDAKISDYLLHHQHRFDLFSPTEPFFQLADMTKDAAGSVKKLSPELATNNKQTLFSHLRDDDDFSLSAAQAAQLLLVAQYYSLGGGISGSSNLYGAHPNYSHAPLVGGAAVVMQGSSLFETLMLYAHSDKLADYHHPTDDKPIWEQPMPDTASPFDQSCLGLCDFLTWPSRYLRLLPDQQGRVSRMYMAQGRATPKEYATREPFFAYRYNAQGKLYPFNLRFGRTFWRDCAIFLHKLNATDNHNSHDRLDMCSWNVQWLRIVTDEQLLSAGLKRSFFCQLIGMENNKAHPLNWLNARMTTCAALLLDNKGENDAGDSLGTVLIQALQYAERVNAYIKKALDDFGQAYFLSAGADEQRKLKALFNADAYYWARLETAFSGLVACLLQELSVTAPVYTAFAQWQTQCQHSALTCITQTIPNSFGSSARELQAYVKALTSLKKRLYADQNPRRAAPKKPHQAEAAHD